MRTAMFVVLGPGFDGPSMVPRGPRRGSGGRPSPLSAEVAKGPSDSDEDRRQSRDRDEAPYYEIASTVDSLTRNAFGDSVSYGVKILLYRQELQPGEVSRSRRKAMAESEFTNKKRRSMA